MKFNKIQSEDKSGFYIFLESKDVEFVNPIDHYSDYFINHRIVIWNELTRKEYRRLGVSELFAIKFIKKNAFKEWFEEYKKIIETEIPENFIKLLESKSKKDQVQLLKGQQLTADTLISFIFKAWTDYNYSFSEYRSEHLAKNIDKSTLPKLIHVDKAEKVEKVGKTLHTNGTLKQIISQRKVIVTKILDKKDEWHCFITTYNSLSGKETWKNGQPHFHYISDKFELSRKELLERIKSGTYPSTSVHIEIKGY